MPFLSASIPSLLALTLTAPPVLGRPDPGEERLELLRAMVTDRYGAEPTPAMTTAAEKVRGHLLDNPRVLQERDDVQAHPALDLTAAYVGWLWGEHKSPPPNELQQWLVLHGGVVPSETLCRLRHHRVWRYRLRDHDVLASVVSDLPQDGRPRYVGGAVLRLGFRDHVEVACYVEKGFTFDPFPRQVEQGATLTITGTAHEPLEDPRVVWDGPGGLAERLLEVGTEATEIDPTASAPGEPFSFTVELPQERGAAWVELVPRDHPHQLGRYMFPIYVGEPPPLAPEPWLLHTPASTTAIPIRELEARILDAWNAYRADHDLDPLEVQETARQMARKRAKVRAREPELPPDHELGVKLERQGVPVYTSYTLQGIFLSHVAHVRTVLLSPHFRQRLLDPRIDAVGIGVALEERHPYWIRWAYAEHFLARVPPLDGEVEARRLREAAERVRARGDRPALDPLPSPLQERLQEVTRSICAGDLELSDKGAMQAALTQNGSLPGWPGSARWHYFSVVGSYVDPESLGQYSRHLTRPGPTALGVAACQGDLPDHPGGELALFLLVGPPGRQGAHR